MHVIFFCSVQSSMYRARSEAQPKIPLTASDLVDTLLTTCLGVNFKFSVSSVDQVGVMFFSNEMESILSDVTNIQFDGTFYTLPVQFYQLWTIFIALVRYTLPAIHSLLTAKTQGLYKTASENIRIRVPQFNPIASMSDWESATRNAFREVFTEIHNYGCWTHYTQHVCAKTPKIGLSRDF